MISPPCPLTKPAPDQVPIPIEPQDLWPHLTEFQQAALRRTLVEIGRVLATDPGRHEEDEDDRT